MEPDSGRFMPSVIRRLSEASSRRHERQPRPNFSVDKESNAATQHESTVKTATLQTMSRISTDSLRTPTNKAKTTYIISSNRPVDASSAISQPENSPARMHTDRTKPTSTRSRKISTAVPVTTLAQHKGEAATIKAPATSADLLARLQALKDFKAWGQRIDRRNDGRSKGQYEAEKPLKIPILRLREQKFGVQPPTGDLDAPTPFSSPYIHPSVGHTNGATNGRQVNAEKAVSPALEVYGSEDNTNLCPQRRNSTRTITISSTPVADLVTRARVRSQSSETRLSSRSQSRGKKYPPISYPSDFDEEKATERAKKKLSRSSSQSQKRLNSVSPMTRLDDSITRNEANDEPKATAHDHRGRPVFYDTIHYFTECSHASPPASRPIGPDAQPRRDPHFNPPNPVVSRSIIPGRCFNCETHYRRAQEDEVVTDFIAEVTVMLQRLDPLLKKVELDMDSPTADDHLLDDQHAALPAVPYQLPENASYLDFCLNGSTLSQLSDEPTVSNTLKQVDRKSSGLSFQDRMAVQIRLLEADIARIERERDTGIEDVWRGYTERWGPGTLGIQKGVNRYSTREYDQVAGTAIQGAAAKPQGSSVDLSHEIQTVKISEGPNDHHGPEAVSRIRSSSRSVSRGRQSHMVSKTDATTTPECTITRSVSNISHRDVQGSRTPGQGKMQIGWIRD